MTDDRGTGIPGEGRPDGAAAMIEAVTAWAARRDDIRALVLVGSHARGDARADSDIDFVLLCADPSVYALRTDWVSTFGAVVTSRLEDWGNVRSVRVHYEHGIEVEFGITGLAWAALPPDRGTGEVLGNGHAILLDRDSLIRRVVRALEEPMEFLYMLRPTRLAMLTDGPTDAEAAVLSRHAAYVEGLAKRGVVEFGGRTQTADESTFGLVVFHADSEEAARGIMRDDPAVRDGVMTASLFPYRIAFRSAKPGGPDHGIR